MTMKKSEKNGSLGIFDSILASSESSYTDGLEIICDGDSWTFGCEIVDPKLAAKAGEDVHPGNYDFEENNDKYRRTKVFSYHLSSLLNARVVNLSWPADDNNTIIRRTMDYITNNYIAQHRSTANLFVIVGWTSPERNSFWYKDENISQPFRLWPNVPHFDSEEQRKFWELYVSHLWHPEEYMIRHVMNIANFQNFCKVHGIKWLNYNSFYQVPKSQVEEWYDLNTREELDKLEYALGGYQFQETDLPKKRSRQFYDFRALWDTIDPVRFYKKDQEFSTFKSFIENPESKVKTPFNGWHPSPEAHKAWAVELANYIKKHNLL